MGISGPVLNPMLQDFLPEIQKVLAANRPLLLTAEPGAGKTTLIPPALLDEAWLAGRKILLLEPRRVAARAAASRMAFLRGEQPGQTIGWRMAQDSVVGPNTRLEVITEGVLTRMLQSDPELSGVGLVLFDEFHERSLHADLGLALCLDVRKALRPDLRLGLLSATLDRELVLAKLPETVAVHAPGRVFPVATEYRPSPETGASRGTAVDCEWVARQVQDGWKAVKGSLLVFLPGGYEIRKVQSLLEDAARQARERLEPLHGSLTAREQAQVLEALPPNQRKTVLATSVAETSVTIPGVELVIDSGWARLGRYDQGRSLDRLVTERLSLASADQRRGRAGRTGPGQCWRLWPQREALPAATDPEIRRADLGPLVLECAVWGARAASDLDWMTDPAPAAWNAARSQLHMLVAIDREGAVTPAGKDLAALGLGPRLGRMVQASRSPVALACAALLSERDRATGSDPDARVRLENLTPLRDTLTLIARRAGAPSVASLPAGWADEVGLTLLAAYPDRLAFRTQTTGVAGQFQLPSGRIVRVRGALAAEETLVVPEADAGAEGAGSNGVGTVWLAAPVDRDVARAALGGLVETKVEIEWTRWRARAFRSRSWGALSFERTGLSLGDVQAELRESLAERLADPAVELPWSAATRQLWVRLSFLKAEGPVEWGWLAGLVDLSQPEVLAERSFSALLHNSLPHDLRRRLETEAPETLVVPSGSRRKLDYREEGEAGTCSVHLEVRIQEVFGLAQSPRVGGQAVVLHLLNPGHKPLQITSDLASFWSTTYQEVRKQMRGQYPRHYWPDNPLEAEPTSRPKPKSSAR